MDIIAVRDHAAVSRVGAEFIAARLQNQPDHRICPATGNSPIECYRQLAALYQAGQFTTKGIHAYQLDAYVGVADADPRSLFGWMDRAFLQPLDIPADRTVRFDEQATDLDAACAAFNRRVIADGGFDLAILGLGPNGHLGFNEPPSNDVAPTRVIKLTETSLISNAKYWGGRDQVPPLALTAGMDLLLASRHILLIVSGAHKHDILQRAMSGPITPDVPASFLQQARSVTVIADEAAWTGIAAS